MNHRVVKMGAAGLGTILLVVGFIEFTEREKREDARRAAAVRAANVEFVKVHPPFFTMRAAEREKLLEKASTLRVGDSADRVLQVLGKPMYDETWASKSIPPGPPTRELAYYLTIYESGLNNEIHDEYIAVYLGNDQHVIKIYRKLKPASQTVAPVGAAPAAAFSPNGAK